MKTIGVQICRKQDCRKQELKLNCTFMLNIINIVFLPNITGGLSSDALHQTQFDLCLFSIPFPVLKKVLYISSYKIHCSLLLNLEVFSLRTVWRLFLKHCIIHEASVLNSSNNSTCDILKNIYSKLK